VTRPPVVLAGIQPMLAESASSVPEGPGWLHEQKYDGVRALGRTGGAVALTTRGGHNKAKQFPEVAQSLAELGRRFEQDLLVDGEIVDAESSGHRGLQRLQRRLPMEKAFEIKLLSERAPAAFVLFDVLAVGTSVLVNRPLMERRMVLERLLSDPVPGLLPSLQAEDGNGMLERARKEDWEGLVSKRADSRYFPGPQRTSAWRKLKIVRRQEFVVGGFTVSESLHRPFRALILGYHDEAGRLVYAGRVGSGFSDRELGDLFTRLHAISRGTTPFAIPPVLGEEIVWVEPRLVVEIRFQDWTDTAHLRDPTFLSIRSDKPAREVVREK
jgi:bifunctional non-homologous end joining protein LigD